MRIGIAHPYDVGVPGGVDAHVRQLAEALRTRGHEVLTLAPGRRRRSADETVAGRSMPIRFNGSVANIAPHPAAARRARRWVREHELDVLHVHEPTVPSASAFAMRAARADGIPVVATFHAAVDRVERLGPLAALQRRHLHGLAARIAVSDEAARTHRSWLGAECEVIPNGLDVAALRPPSSVENYPVAPGSGHPAGPQVLFLGRADEPRKGMRVLAAAWPAVRAARPDATLAVAGPGGEAATAALSAALSDDLHDVQVHGRVTEAEKVQLLQRADVLVAPHTGGESFGIVLVEAMAAGTPVVASDLPAFAAVLDADGTTGVRTPLGLLARRGDPDDLAARLVECLEDTAGAARRAGLALRAVRRYDWSEVAARVEDVYRRVAGPRSPGRTSIGPGDGL
ncbi:glycosyltransferase family 4 protein [Georgenia sp. Z1491]|uniref:glycosyltransferase family 4 protein n=1 Tax=Georgenia sp. Z1491 TaxID=3416707 RepID=UPI003CEBD472